MSEVCALKTWTYEAFPWSQQVQCCLSDTTSSPRIVRALLGSELDKILIESNLPKTLTQEAEGKFHAQTLSAIDLLVIFSITACTWNPSFEVTVLCVTKFAIPTAYDITIPVFSCGTIAGPAFFGVVQARIVADQAHLPHKVRLVRPCDL